MKLKIHPELRSLIPPLQSEELQLLEYSILNDGCRDKIVTWDGYIIDGHNRYDICTRHNIPFDTVKMKFADIEAAKDWMDANQLGRRNLTPDQRKIIIGRRYNREKRSMPEAGSMKGKSYVQNDHSLTSEKLAKENNISAPTVRRYAKDSQFFDKLSKQEPETAQKVWSGEQKLSEVKKVHVTNNSGENEWYTPVYITLAAKRVMGSIDTDPASSDLANTFVEAKKYYTMQNSGLVADWKGNVWMNPPYGNPIISDFIDAFCHRWESGQFIQGIVLVNNATDTKWFQKIANISSVICFFKGRISFLDSSGNESKKPLQGQAVLYFGHNKKSFINEFSEYGICLTNEEL